MLIRLAHRIVSVPRVYDAIQFAVGVKAVERRLSAEVEHAPCLRTVVDVGGGTGLHRALFPPTSLYFCVDLDREKLYRYRKRYQGGVALLADATKMPLRDSSADVVLCTFVAHHLPDEALRLLFDEVRRVLKAGGTFLFMDPLWVRWRVPSRALWRFDVGRHPRTARTLEGMIADRFHVLALEQFSVLHSYLLIRAAPRA